MPDEALSEEDNAYIDDLKLNQFEQPESPAKAVTEPAICVGCGHPCKPDDAETRQVPLFPSGQTAALCYKCVYYHRPHLEASGDRRIWKPGMTLPPTLEHPLVVYIPFSDIRSLSDGLMALRPLHSGATPSESDDSALNMVNAAEELRDFCRSEIWNPHSSYELVRTIYVYDTKMEISKRQVYRDGSESSQILSAIRETEDTFSLEVTEPDGPPAEP